MNKTAQIDECSKTVTIATITDEQIYAAMQHARRNGDRLSAQLMSFALERGTTHPAVAYVVDYFNTKVAA